MLLIVMLASHSACSTGWNRSTSNGFRWLFWEWNQILASGLRLPWARAGLGAGATMGNSELCTAPLCISAPCLKCCISCTPFLEHMDGALPHTYCVLPQQAAAGWAGEYNCRSCQGEVVTQPSLVWARNTILLDLLRYTIWSVPRVSEFSCRYWQGNIILGWMRVFLFIILLQIGNDYANPWSPCLGTSESKIPAWDSVPFSSCTAVRASTSNLAVL